MKSAVFFALLPSLLGALSVTAAVHPIPKKVENLPTVPNKFIIEVDDLASIPNKRSFKRSLDAVYDSLNSRAIKFNVNKEFEAEGIFVGASLTLTTADDVAAVTNTPGIKGIHPVRIFKQPVLAKRHVITGSNDPELPPTALSPLIMTGVDKLHAEGLIGTGIKIGILDTGIDYKHPALGGSFGAKAPLVYGGYDFVGDNYTGYNEPVPDSDPHDNCNGHGTHVAGIIAAQPNNVYNATGVAYGAKLAAYRVFGCSGSVTEEVLADALIRGYKDGNDILTLSLGGADGWSASISAIVAQRLAKLGTVLTIAAGNDGSAGSWYASSPGTAEDVISVGSVENTVIALWSATVKGADYGPITYFGEEPFPVLEELPIYPISNSTTVADDACEPLPASTPDLSKYLVIVRRGTCTFVTKLEHIAAKGGKATLVYDNGSGFAGISVGAYKATLIRAADGEFLVNQYVAGKKITISFPQDGPKTNVASENGGLMSTFSTYGPSYDFNFKPALSAPGGNILSTYPLALGGYAVLSGTSMATPFMAGTSALVLARKGKSLAVRKGLRTTLQTTATKVPSSLTDGEPFQTLTQAGAGLVDAYAAIHGTTVVSTGQLVLNDTAHFQGTHIFTVTNTGKSTKKYVLKHVPAGTALTVQANSIYTEFGPVPLSTKYASATILPSTFSIRAGQTQAVIVSIKPPTGLDASRYPVYSGFIDIASSATDITHVSYLGLAASLKNKQVVDNTEEYFGVKTPAILDAAGNWQTKPTNYTFVDGDWPSFLWRLSFGTPSFRIDLVDANIKLTTTLSSRGLLHLFFSFPNPHKGGSFAQVKIVGTLASWQYTVRNGDDDDSYYNLFNLPTPTFADGTAIKKGSYRVLVRALRVTGNPTREEDYESWLSPILGVTGP